MTTEVIYYFSCVLLFISLLVLTAATVTCLINPRLLNKKRYGSRYSRRNISRLRILTIGGFSALFVFFGLGAVAVATEPENLKTARLDQQTTLPSQAAFAPLENLQQVEQVPETRTETKTEPISFPTTERSDASLAKDKTRTEVEGVDGQRTVTYQVTYLDGKETARTVVKSEVTKQPVTKVVLVGTYIASLKPTVKAPSATVYYKDCTAMRAAKAAPIKAGQPGYRTQLDADKDGLACE